MSRWTYVGWMNIGLLSVGWMNVLEPSQRGVGPGGTLGLYKPVRFKFCMVTKKMSCKMDP